MAKQIVINGETFGDGFGKVNSNFTELYRKEYAYCYIDEIVSGVITPMASSLLWYEILGTYVCPLEHNFVAGATSIVYTGTGGDFNIIISYNFSASKATELKFGVKIDGVLQAPKSLRKIANSGDSGSCVLVIGTTLVTNNAIQIVSNADVDNVNLETYSVQAFINKLGDDSV